MNVGERKKIFNDVSNVVKGVALEMLCQGHVIEFVRDPKVGASASNKAAELLTAAAFNFALKRVPAEADITQEDIVGIALRARNTVATKMRLFIK